MSSLPGIPCGNPLYNTKEMHTIDYYDGPMSLIAEVGDKLFYVHWFDLPEDKVGHEWLVVRASKQRLIDMHDNKVDLHTMLTQPEDGHLFLIVANGPLVLDCVRISPDALPLNEIPDPGVFNLTTWDLSILDHIKE